MRFVIPEQGGAMADDIVRFQIEVRTGMHQLLQNVLRLSKIQLVEHPLLVTAFKDIGSVSVIPEDASLAGGQARRHIQDPCR